MSLAGVGTALCFCLEPPREAPGDASVRNGAALNDLVLERGTKDPNFAIGPSYFMTKALAEPGALERIWSHALMPLLEEQYYGSEDDVGKVFALSAVRASLARVVGNGLPPLPNET